MALFFLIDRTNIFTSSSVVWAAESNVLKVGLLLPPKEPQSVSVREGVLLARDQANKEGSRKVEVIIRGRTGQWGADGVEAARMVTDDGVEGLIAPPDGAASHLALQVSGRTAVPVVSLCPDLSVGRTGVPWILRVVPRTVDEAEALFDGLAPGTVAKTSRWTAIVPDGRPGREISRDLAQAAFRSSVRFEKILQLNTDLTNAGFVQEQALVSRPNVMFLWLPPVPAGRIARNFRAAGYSGILAGPSWLQSAEFIAAAGAAFEGFIVPGTARSNEVTARWNSFQTSYSRFWHHEPDTTAAMSYDAVLLLVHLLAQPAFQAPPHRLTPGFSWPGVTGDLIFDSEGNRKAKLNLLRGHSHSFINAN